MRSSVKSGLTVLAAVAVTSAGLATAIAGEMSTAACTLRADVPDENNNARVGREGCSSEIPVDGYIKEDINNWPDDEVGSESFWGGVEWVNGHCDNGDGDYYSQVDSSSGATAQSARADRC